MNGERLHLGIECGGTHTVALVAKQGAKEALARFEAGPANLRLISDPELEALFRSIAQALPQPSSLGVGMAGVRTDEDRTRITGIVDRVWTGVPCTVDHDLVTALEAAAMDGRTEVSSRIVVLSGTGSCCFGRNSQGITAKLGGWGHLLGDCGSGYAIAHSALRMLIDRFERTGSVGVFGPRVLQALLINDLEPLVGWIQSASKRDVAALTPLVFGAAADGDTGAREVIETALGELLTLALSTADRLEKKKGIGPVEFVLAGSVFVRQPGWLPFIRRHLKAGCSRASVRVLKRESVWGAVALAAKRVGTVVQAVVPPSLSVPLPSSVDVSPTERRNPKSMNLDRMPLRKAIQLMLEEESTVPSAIGAQVAGLERLIRAAVRTLSTGGRLFYVGAGTSGRLGVLDASECPPTFRTPPHWVQGVMAGGEKALHTSVEGAEDDATAGGAAMLSRAVDSRDLLVGIAASGRTPFVWGALQMSRQRGATTALICFNPHLRFPRGSKPDVVLAVDVGPEILTGSTRLKAGTATKLILNTLTTLTMVRLGKTASNLMLDLNPSNVKLRDRAVRIVCDLTGVDVPTALTTLQSSGWRVKEAVECLGRSC